MDGLDFLKPCAHDWVVHCPIIQASFLSPTPHCPLLKLVVAISCVENPIKNQCFIGAHKKNHVGMWVLTILLIEQGEWMSGFHGLGSWSPRSGLFILTNMCVEKSTYIWGMNVHSTHKGEACVLSSVYT